MGAPIGHTKNGGRQKGTPNHVTTELKAAIEKIVTDGVPQFVANMDEMNAADYCKTYLSLLSFVLPKRQAVTIDDELNAEYKQLEKLLHDTPAQYVDAVFDKIQQLQMKTNERE